MNGLTRNSVIPESLASSTLNLELKPVIIMMGTNGSGERLWVRIFLANSSPSIGSMIQSVMMRSGSLLHANSNASSPFVAVNT